MAQIKADEITQLLREQIANNDDSKVQVDESDHHRWAARRRVKRLHKHLSFAVDP